MHVIGLAEVMSVSVRVSVSGIYLDAALAAAREVNSRTDHNLIYTFLEEYTFVAVI